MNCQRFMNCPRCGSTMIFKKFIDYGGHFWGWECVFCKEIVDQIPRVHRPLNEDWNEIEKRSFPSDGRGATGYQGGRIVTHKDFVPEKYGMVICPVCNGKGFLIKDSGLRNNSSRSACAKCGGFGAIRKEEELVRSLGN